MRDREQPQEPPPIADDDVSDLGEFRGVVLDDEMTISTVPEPPPEPAQPIRRAPEDPAGKQ